MKFNYVMSYDTAVEFSENFNHTTEEMESRMNELFDSDKVIIELRIFHNNSLHDRFSADYR